MTVEIHNKRPKDPNPRRTCDRTGCPNAPAWQVGFTIFAPAKYGNHPVNAELGMFICAEHGKTAKVEDFMSDAGWAQILQGFRMSNRVEPDRALTRLRLLPILRLE